MIERPEALQAVLARVFGTEPPPKPFNAVAALLRVQSGETTAADAAREIGTTARALKAANDAANPLHQLFGEASFAFAPELETKVRATLGQLVIGNLAERVFEDIYRETVGTSELRLEDQRIGGTDTDYLVLNGKSRPVFRLNIKFHGSQFRKAKELVGLEPEDCFALATYKIHGALLKQDKEHLPYIFVIVGVPNLTGGVVGREIPAPEVQLAMLSRNSSRVAGKRRIEDTIVEAMTSRPAEFAFASAAARFLEQIRAASWRVLSARRADRLLRELLFDRAYALRVRGFAQNYRGAELDMHFSITNDLNELEKMLTILRDNGLPALSVHLERGTF
jgi:hypothetical protein